MNSKRLGMWIWAMGLLFLTWPTVAHAEHRLSAEFGSWTTGLEYESPFGLYADLHCPWAIVALEGGSSGFDWVVPIGGRLGYALHMGQVWSIRLGLRVDQYWLQSSTYQTRTWLGLELGFRWQHPSGFRAGIDLVPLGFQRWTGHDDDDFPFDFWAPAILLSQVSVGWRWSL